MYVQYRPYTMSASECSGNKQETYGVTLCYISPLHALKVNAFQTVRSTWNFCLRMTEIPFRN